MNLNTRAMLASLRISQWSATRTDKKVSREVAAQHAVAERRAGHYRKHAINPDAATFKAVVTAAGAMRTKHIDYTLPWASDGARILPAALFAKYTDDMRELRAAFNVAVSNFVRDFPALKDAARVELNGLYNENDYPSNMAAKFEAKTTIVPLPDADDFRVKLPDDAVATIRADLEEEVTRATETAMREPYERLYAHISRMVERLSDPKHTFRDSLVGGLAELCELLPALNITGDTRLEVLRTRAQSLISGIDAQTLRDSPTVRESVAKRAQEIQDTMAAFMGGVQ